MGGTAKKLNETYRELCRTEQIALFAFYCLNVHEAENLIPLDVLDILAETLVKDMYPGLNYLKKMISSGNGDSILYYDFKEGIIFKGNDPFDCYWKEISNSVGDGNMPKLCNKTLDKAIEFLQSKNGDKDNVDVIKIDDYLISLWNDIGKKVFSWGCAAEPTRA